MTPYRENVRVSQIEEYEPRWSFDWWFICGLGCCAMSAVAAAYLIYKATELAWRML